MFLKIETLMQIAYPIFLPHAEMEKGSQWLVIFKSLSLIGTREGAVPRVDPMGLLCIFFHFWDSVPS